ncbi:MAG: 4-(cytidine 5'-diphospho)-2-C-methyl-D-erythritol kinase [Chthoniobacterales bacterium]
MKRLAPAKINLSLEILGRRPDGFHDLRSLFLPISLTDTIDCTSAENFSFTCSDPTIPTDDRNLVVRAARLFGHGTLPNVAIHLEKNIPHSAGLGGGSSDAATTLLALNDCTETPLAFPELETLAATLGSDVPFFLHRSAAWCEGRGEIVRPIPPPGEFHIILFKPPFGVPTPWAYQNLAASQPLPGIPMEVQSTPFGTLANDLERPVFEKYLLLALVKQFLLAQPETLGALMSGSGSTMFALTRDLAAAESVREKLLSEFGERNWTAIVTPF